MIRIDGTLGYPGTTVLPDLHWTVEPGDFVLLLGSNGSGKTTILRTCAGVLKPLTGETLVAGHKPTGATSKARIGYLPDPPPLYEELTPLEHCELVQRLWGDRVRPARIDELVESFRLQAVLNQRCDSLSLGMRKRLGIALAFLHTPDILLLDEPYNGLDRASGQALTSTITSVINNGGCCIVSTHQPQHLVKYATRVTILYESAIVYDQAPKGWDPYEWGFTDEPSVTDNDTSTDQPSQ